MEGLGFEAEGQDEREDYKRNALLDNLKLNQIERTAGDIGPDAVGGNHDAILKERHAPRRQDNHEQGPVGTDLHLLELEVTIPRECHQNV